MNGSEGASRQPDSIKIEINRVLTRAKLQTNHTGLNTAIDDLAEIIDELETQEQRLEIMETVAMTSDNENIMFLRNELFTTVKLIHGDKINAALNEMNKDVNVGTFSTVGGIGLSSTPLHNHSFNITASSTATTTTGGVTISSPMQVDGKSMPNCEDVEEIINATLNKRSVWNRVKEIFSREKKDYV